MLYQQPVTYREDNNIYSCKLGIYKNGIELSMAFVKSKRYHYTQEFL